MNAIYLRRRLKVTVPTDQGETHRNAIAAMQKNIANLGFILSPDLCLRLETLPPAKVESFYHDLVGALKTMVGAHRTFHPMYPNFPAQVMKMSEAELYWNAIAHYCTNRLLPRETEQRPPLLDGAEPKVIQLGSREDFERIFTLLASAKSSLSAEDKEDVIWFVRQYREGIENLLPPDLPCKENLAIVGAALLRNTTFGNEWLSSRVKTATDVLRLAVAMSGGDVSLATPAKFATFPRKERRLLLSWVERCANPIEDMLRWKDRWVRLGERLHPGEFSARFPKAFTAFDVLRNQKPFVTFNGSVERHLAEGDGAAAAALLQSRPGELTRRLDHLLRTASNPESVISAFGEVASKASTTVLLQAMAHFAHRSEPQALRTFFPKGDVGKVQAVQDALPALPVGCAEAILRLFEHALTVKFAALPPLGRCYLDPRLVDFMVPLSQRSASKSLRTVARGSRLPLPDCKVLRFFVWWKNGKARTDIDLSAAVFDSDCNYVDVVSYYNLKSLGGCHSGDIVNAPEGAAEFIDLDVELTKSRGVRYIVMSIHSFTMQPYCDLPECFAGWMARKKANSGEIFEPRTVENKIDVAANTQICIPAIFDLVEGRVIWADLALRSNPRWNNVAGNSGGVSLMLRAMLGLRKPSLHALFGLHIKARGSMVFSAAEADTIFSVDTGVTPFDTDTITSQYL